MVRQRRLEHATAFLDRLLVDLRLAAQPQQVARWQAPGRVACGKVEVELGGLADLFGRRGLRLSLAGALP